LYAAHVLVIKTNSRTFKNWLKYFQGPCCFSRC